MRDDCTEIRGASDKRLITPESQNGQYVTSLSISYHISFRD
jgi:hypothetical protein